MPTRGAGKSKSAEGFAQLVHAESVKHLSESEKHYLTRIINGAARMDQLVREVLTYSQVGHAAIQITPLPLAALVKGCIEQYS